jgi:hypothetical protein
LRCLLELLYVEQGCGDGLKSPDYIGDIYRHANAPIGWEADTSKKSGTCIYHRLFIKTGQSQVVYVPMITEEVHWFPGEGFCGKASPRLPSLAYTVALCFCNGSLSFGDIMIWFHNIARSFPSSRCYRVSTRLMNMSHPYSFH